jgi:cold shock CspA family protein
VSPETAGNAERPFTGETVADVAKYGSRAPRTGTVAAFDDDSGRGSVVTSDGVSYGFHSTAIADGTRTIEAGTRVFFTVQAAHGGRYEAGFVSRVRFEEPAAEAGATGARGAEGAGGSGGDA